MYNPETLLTQFLTIPKPLLSHYPVYTDSGLQRLTSPGRCYRGRCHSWRHRPLWPAWGAGPLRSPGQGGTGTTAATHSPAAAGTGGPPAADGRGSGPTGHTAAGTDDRPVGKTHTSSIRYVRTHRPLYMFRCSHNVVARWRKKLVSLSFLGLFFTLWHFFAVVICMINLSVLRVHSFEIM